MSVIPDHEVGHGTEDIILPERALCAYGKGGDGDASELILELNCYMEGEQNSKLKVLVDTSAEAHISLEKKFPL